MSVDLDALIAHLVDRADIVHAPDRSREWTDAEMKQLRQCCAALMTDVEIALQMNRSVMAVHLRRERSGIPAVRNTPGWMSSHKVSKRLGMNDQRPVIGWIQKGLLLGRSLPQGSTCWMVHEVSLRRFVTRPENWPRFNPAKVKDPHLKRLIDLAQQRWGDEWLTTPQVRDLVGVDLRDINRFIKMRRLRSVKVVNKDGRENDNPRWALNYVRRSEVLSIKWQYGRGEAMSKLTPSGLRWVRQALAMGWSAAAIARSMKVSGATVSNWIKKELHANTN